MWKPILLTASAAICIAAGPITIDSSASYTSSVSTDIAIGGGNPMEVCSSTLSCNSPTVDLTSASATVTPTSDITKTALSVNTSASVGFDDNANVDASVSLDDSVTISGGSGTGTVTICPTGGISVSGEAAAFSASFSFPGLTLLQVTCGLKGINSEAGIFQFIYGVPFGIDVDIQAGGGPGPQDTPDGTNAGVGLSFQVQVTPQASTPEPASAIPTIFALGCFMFRRHRVSNLRASDR